MGSIGSPHSHQRQGIRCSWITPLGYLPTPAREGRMWKLSSQWEKPGCEQGGYPDLGKVCLRGSWCPGCCCNFPNHKALLGAPAKADPNQPRYQHCHLLHGHAPGAVSSEGEPLKSFTFSQSHVTCSSRHTPTRMPTKLVSASLVQVYSHRNDHDAGTLLEGYSQQWSQHPQSRYVSMEMPRMLICILVHTRFYRATYNNPIEML